MLALEEKNASLPFLRNAPVAQLDRASDYGSEGWAFKSLRVYQRRPKCVFRLSLVGAKCSTISSPLPRCLEVKGAGKIKVLGRQAALVVSAQR